jgi:YVTN family beta-propeller protein
MVAAAAVLWAVAPGQSIESQRWTGLLLNPDVIIYNPLRQAALVGSQYGGAVAVEVGAECVRAGRTVSLPGRATAFAFGASTGRIYCSHTFDYCVSAIDAATLAVLGSVTVGNYPGALLSVGDRVYCANTRDSSVSVIVAGPDTVRATITCGAYPAAFCYNSTSRKLYVACRDADRVTVIDADRDSIIVQVAVGEDPIALCWDSAYNRVYCVSRTGQSVAVIDGVTNAVRRTIGLVWLPQSVCLLKVAGKVFVGHSVADTVTVIRCGPDTIEALVPAGDGVLTVLASETQNRVFGLNLYGESITVIDGASNVVVATVPADSYPSAGCFTATGETLLVALSGRDGVAALARDASRFCARVALSGMGPDAVCANPSGERVWVANQNSDNIAVFDAATLGLTSLLPAGDRPTALACDATGARVYCANQYSRTVTAVDAAGDSVRAVLPVGGQPGVLCAGSGGQVYCGQLWGGHDTLVVLAGDSVRARVSVGGPSHALAWSPRSNKLYCACRESDAVWVIDGTADTVVTVIPMPAPGAICLGPDSAKVYCSAAESSSVWVIDTYGDSVVARVTTEENVTEMAPVPGADRVYCACFLNTPRLQVIDAVLDSVTGYVTVGWQPYTMFYSAPNHLLYVTNRSMMPDSLVAVVDCSTNQVVTRLRTTLYACRFAASPANSRVFLTLSDAGRVAVIREPTVGVGEERRTPDARRATPGPTFVRGVLRMADGSRKSADGAVLLDAAGRKVLELQPGANDVRRLAPGVYFAVRKGSRGQGVEGSSQRVVITR